MNYGLTFMEHGDVSSALDYFQRAAVFTPNFTTTTAAGRAHAAGQQKLSRCCSRRRLISCSLRFAREWGHCRLSFLREEISAAPLSCHIQQQSLLIGNSTLWLGEGVSL